jgi:hypothetical protein
MKPLQDLRSEASETPRCRREQAAFGASLEKLTVAQQIDTFFSSYRILRFIAVFTRAATGRDLEPDELQSYFFEGPSEASRSRSFKTALTSQGTHYVSSREPSRSLLFRAIVAVCCGRNAELLYLSRLSKTPRY